MNLNLFHVGALECMTISMFMCNVYVNLYDCAHVVINTYMFVCICMCWLYLIVDNLLLSSQSCADLR